MGTCGNPTPATPYLCSLAAAYTTYTQWHGVSHPSLPNYLAFDSGSAQGCISDACPGPYATTDLGGQLTTQGVPWVAYMELMPSACYTGASSTTYARKHNPFVYFNDVLRPAAPPTSSRTRAAPMQSTLTGSSAPSFVWITPNLADDMHDGTVQQGDTWLKTNLAAGALVLVVYVLQLHGDHHHGRAQPATTPASATTARPAVPRRRGGRSAGGVQLSSLRSETTRSQRQLPATFRNRQTFSLASGATFSWNPRWHCNPAHQWHGHRHGSKPQSRGRPFHIPGTRQLHRRHIRPTVNGSYCLASCHRGRIS